MSELFSELIDLITFCLSLDEAAGAMSGIFAFFLIFAGPFALCEFGFDMVRAAWERRRAAECFARYRSETSTVCRVRSCPHAAGCQFYEKHSSLWSRLKLWIQKKKNSRE